MRKEMETVRKKQMKVLEVKNIIFEMEISLSRIDSELDAVENEYIFRCGRGNYPNQNTRQRVKSVKKDEQSLSDMWVNIK